MHINQWCRAGLTVAVIFALAIALFLVEVNDFKHPVPGRRQLRVLAAGNLTKTVQENSCKCKLQPWPGGRNTAQQLDLLLPWRNLTTREDLRRHHPNLPVDFFHRASQDQYCSLLPTPFSIEWRNKHWQKATLSDNSIFHLYSAIYDPDTGPSVQLLGVTMTMDPPPSWCHVWHSSKTPPLVVPVTSYAYLDYQGKTNYHQMPFLLTCPLPRPARDLPLAVSLVAQPCAAATNLLQVAGGKEREASAYSGGKRPKYSQTMKTGWVPAVCGPALYYYDEDFSLRVVEWLELLRAQGFGRVFLYATDVHPNISKVLRYYEQEGFVQVTDYTYPPPYINEPGIRRLWTMVERMKMFSQENIYFTDCVLRHMHQHRFISHFDPDEVPVLLQHHNFTHFLDDFLKGKGEKWSPGFRLQWNYFYNNVEPKGEGALLPKFLWALRHTRRPIKDLVAGSGKMKPMYDMDTVRGVFSHGSLWCTKGKCSHDLMPLVPTKVAYLGHFSKTCSKCAMNTFKEDLTLHKYKAQVVPRVKKVLRTLRLL